MKPHTKSLATLFRRDLSLTNYIFVVFLFLLLLASLGSILGNIITNYPPIANVKWALALIFVFVGFWLVRIDRFVEVFKTGIFLAVQFLVIWPSWFMGGGDNAITIMYMLLVAVEALLLFERAALKWLMVAISAISCVAFNIITYRFPHLVQATDHTQNVFVDNLIQLVIIFLIAAVSIALYTDQYDRQHAQLQALNVRLEWAATVDELSQVFNRRKILEQLSLLVQGDASVFVLMIDIDYFKKVNDLHGHQMGDRVISHFAAHLSRAVGDQGKIGRYGGDEFLVLFTNVSEDALAEIACMIVRVPPLEDFPLAVSGGLSKLLPGQSGSQVIHAADNLLFQAKRNGRNQINLYDGSVITL